MTAGTPEPAITELCAGYGGLGMAVQQVLGGRVVWVSEHEPATPEKPNPRRAAARLLAHRFPDAPNVGDLTVADWSTVERPDILTAGWPCQPWSAAGKRLGVDDDRAIWPHVARAVRDLRPRVVFLENVGRVVAAGELGRAVADLAGLGYVGSWCCLRASDVGAPHGRLRCFIVAVAQDADIAAGGEWRLAAPGEAEGWWARADAGGRGGTPPAYTDGGYGDGRERGRGRGAGRRAAAPRRGDRGGAGSPAADTQGVGRDEGWPESAGLVGGSDAAVGGAAAAADADGDGRARLGGLHSGERDIDGRDGADADGDATEPAAQWGDYAPATDRWAAVLGRAAPAPTVAGRNGQRLSPAFTEWMMGLPAGWVTGVPGLSRADMLHVLGNGVVPQQAAAALRLLLPRAAAHLAARAAA